MTPIDELKIFGSASGTINDAFRTLNFASIKEINLLLDKINYYLEHIKVINSSQIFCKNRAEILVKKEFLEKLQNILHNEIRRRDGLISFN